MIKPNESSNIVTMQVSITTLLNVLNSIKQYADVKQCAYVCVSNVHMCMEVYDDDNGFAAVVNNADIVVPDGRPIYWAQKLLGAKNAEQVRGMDLTYGLCDLAEAKAYKVGFYGGEATTLTAMSTELLTLYPKLNITYSCSPPFRNLSDVEKVADIKAINDSGVDFLFVGLGCPKQERWMADNKEQLNCVMLGVGAAFDFIAGNKSHAPEWMQKAGLEWLFRLTSEPKRLWRRYLMTNPRFIFYFLRQWLVVKFK